MARCSYTPPPVRGSRVGKAPPSGRGGARRRNRRVRGGAGGRRAGGWVWLAPSAPDSLAWAACGARPYVNLLGPAGVFTLLYGPRDVLALTNRIEAPRLRDEELAGLPVEITAHDWPQWNAE